MGAISTNTVGDSIVTNETNQSPLVKKLAARDRQNDGLRKVVESLKAQNVALEEELEKVREQLFYFSAEDEAPEARKGRLGGLLSSSKQASVNSEESEYMDAKYRKMAERAELIAARLKVRDTQNKALRATIEKQKSRVAQLQKRVAAAPKK